MDIHDRYARMIAAALGHSPDDPGTARLAAELRDAGGPRPAPDPEPPPDRIRAALYAYCVLSDPQACATCDREPALRAAGIEEPYGPDTMRALRETALHALRGGGAA